jgi:hypothetical protein
LPGGPLFTLTPPPPLCIYLQKCQNGCRTKWTITSGLFYRMLSYCRIKVMTLFPNYPKKLFWQDWPYFSPRWTLLSLFPRKTSPFSPEIFYSKSTKTHFFPDCGVPSVVHQTAITTDFDATSEQQPWIVSLGRFVSASNWSHICSGSLITNRHVLTAARCFTEDRQLEKRWERDRQWELTLKIPGCPPNYTKVRREKEVAS